jgi:hypothetical protein
VCISLRGTFIVFVSLSSRSWKCVQTAAHVTSLPSSSLLTSKRTKYFVFHAPFGSLMLLEFLSEQMILSAVVKFTVQAGFELFRVHTAYIRSGSNESKLISSLMSDGGTEKKSHKKYIVNWLFDLIHKSNYFKLITEQIRWIYNMYLGVNTDASYPLCWWQGNCFRSQKSHCYEGHMLISGNNSI